jgi:pyruvate dehydrogenase E2 component (dihydrolipoamide acetyltransferase)
MATDVVVPPLGTTVETLTFVQWYRREGEPVEKDEPLFAVETDKATLDVEAPAAGILRQVSVVPGEAVAVLSRIAVIAAPGEVLAAPEPVGPAFQPAEPAHPQGQAGKPAPPDPVPPDRRFSSPRARRLAETGGLEWRGLAGTGPEGAVVERDVRTALAAREGDRVAAARAVAIAGPRAMVAARMLASATTTAAVTLATETDAAGLVEWRRRLAAEGVAASYNDLLLAILGRALPQHPALNAWLEAGEVRRAERVHVGLAVDGERGLLVPVVRDVDRKGVPELAAETAALVEAARQGRLPAAAQGGTFTLTNLGMFGIDAFTPLINLPECAILGVGRIRLQPAVVGDTIQIRPQVWLSLTFDHRLVDGGPAARFLQRVAQLVEDPP